MADDRGDKVIDFPLHILLNFVLCTETTDFLKMLKQNKGKQNVKIKVNNKIWTEPQLSSR